MAECVQFVDPMKAENMYLNKYSKARDGDSHDLGRLSSAEKIVGNTVYLADFLFKFDNPAAHAPPMTRRLTHLYLVFVTLALLFYPSDLCADWTMGSIPLITSFSDWSNACTLFAFIGLLVAALCCASPRTQSRQALTLSSYNSSTGAALSTSIKSFLLRWICGGRTGSLCPYSKRQAYVILAILCSGFALKTFYLKYDWKDEYSLFTSALKFDEALLYFQQAVRVQPDDMGARINVGRTLVQLNRLDEAEEAYYQALDFFPKPKKGVVYHTRVSPKDLTIFINLANLLAKNDSRLDEADALLRRAISLREDNVDAYQNRGSILVRQRRFQEAENMYRTALKYRYTSAALHYNLGVVLLETNRTEEASHEVLTHVTGSFIELFYQTLFALASSYSETADAELRKKAITYFEELPTRNYEPIRVNFALAILYTDFGEFEKAARRYRAVLEVDPVHRSSLFNLALMYHNELNDSLAAIPLLNQLIESHPDHIKSYMLLGDIELSVVKNATFAIKLFEEAVELAPNNLQARHNYCVAFTEGTADLEKGKECLQGATLLADPDNPNDEFVFRHLAPIRAKRRAET
ncbi:hypothetical protein Aperf_G00000123793 [Anoplocephala perfoliata]